MSTAPLHVWYGTTLVGTLEYDAAYQTFTFDYSAAWLTDPQRFAISLSMPLAAQTYQTQAQAFFSNLLPEGMIRELVIRRLGISADNDFALLRAIGGECAGALCILPDSEAPTRHGDYLELLPAQLKRLADLEEPSIFAAQLGDKQLRLSLAGAEDKLAVLIENDRIYLPQDNAASSHILKFPNANYKHLVVNEVICMQTAAALDLKAAEVSYRPDFGVPCVLVTRFDRIYEAPRVVRRLHQEDLCQARAQSSRHKYEMEGGASFVHCVELIRQHSVTPLQDTERLLRWQIFNWLIGNCDGHAKNLALYLQPGYGPALTPFYDLLSTRVYPRLSTNLAMGIQGEFNPDLIRASHWAELATQLTIQPRFMLSLAQTMLEELPDALAEVIRTFKQEYGVDPMLDMLQLLIRKRIKKAKQALKVSNP